jgi:hypothetical protein
MPKSFSPNVRRHAGVLATGALLALSSWSVIADDLDEAVEAEITIAEEGARSQQTIDNINSETEDLLAEYRQVVGETEGLRVYNQQMQAIVDSQEEEKESINRQLTQLEETNRDIVPLMVEMVDMYGQLIESDVPFLIETRRSRFYDLQDVLTRSDITDSERYRRIIEAYQIELDYGRNTSSYRAKLPNDGPTVDFLKIGRTLLVYQTLDGKQVGWFHPNNRQFEVLPDRFRSAIAEGIAIAQAQSAPNLIRLPVIAPEAAQ